MGTLLHDREEGDAGTVTETDLRRRYSALGLYALSAFALVLTDLPFGEWTDFRLLHRSEAIVTEAMKLVIAVALHSGLSKEHILTQASQDYTERKSVRERKLHLTNVVNQDVHKYGTAYAILAFPAALQVIGTLYCQVLPTTTLDAHTFRILYQCRLVVSAGIAAAILPTRPSVITWLCVLTLVTGMAINSLPSDTTPMSVLMNAAGGYTVIGLFIGAFKVAFSSILDVFLEDTLKFYTAASNSEGKNPVRFVCRLSCCLHLWTIILLLLDAYFDPIGLSELQFTFCCYDRLQWTNLIMRAAVGAAATYVLAFASIITKGFAASLSYVVATLVWSAFNHWDPSRNFLYGLVLILVATYVYSISEKDLGLKRMDNAVKHSAQEKEDTGRIQLPN